MGKSVKCLLHGHEDLSSLVPCVALAQPWGPVDRRLLELLGQPVSSGYSKIPCLGTVSPRAPRDCW